MTKTAYIESTDCQIRSAAICQNCKHFYPHYVKMGAMYATTFWGHCDCGRVTARKVYNVCGEFKEEKQ